MPVDFHDVLFPTDISLGSQGGPERRTDIVVLGSGDEQRNSRWADSRRRYNAGYGVRDLDQLYAVVAFFEERRGRLYGFRWHDPVDSRSGAPGAPITANDEPIGLGDGVRTVFDLTKTYGAAFAPWRRRVTKPVAGSVRVAVDGVELAAGVGFVADPATGQVTFLPGHVPAPGAIVTAGFAFHVPVRFDTDSLEINLRGFRSGAIPNIPLVEVRV